VGQQPRLWRPKLRAAGPQRSCHRAVAHRDLAVIAKKAIQEGRTIVFVDEAGFYLLAPVARTYAPMGETPFLRVPLTWDHLSAISAITANGALYVRIQKGAFNGTSVVCFLQHLLTHIPGKHLLIWDGLPAHHGPAVREFLAQGGAQRIHMERLPGYAPDLNPDEGV
jgi:DDE superfamily endonuclease